jgi:4-hydroxy 2-oxovalerate aldolase
MTFLNILSKIKSKILKTPTVSKIRENVVLEKPAYFNRHEGRDFLILGTGPSLIEYGDRIKAFAKKKKLIVIGCNYITEFMTPDYHLFVNRYRFIQFASTINPEHSIPLLNINFSDELIHKKYTGAYELIMAKNMQTPEENTIDQEGVIYYCGTSATLMVQVAYVMGARNLYIAGVDGYNVKGGEIHYTNIAYKKKLSKEELDAKYKHWFLSIQGESFDAISLWAKINHRLPFIFLTPTNYEKYYDQELLENIPIRNI